MASGLNNPNAMKDPAARLEDALVDEFLGARGHDRRSLQTLPEADARRLEAEAAAYASSRLAEIEARAHYVHDLHHPDH